MVAAVVSRDEAVGMLRVAHDDVEVDDGIEVAGSADPLVDGLAIGLAERTWMVVGRTDVGSDCRAVDSQAVRVSPLDNLLVHGDEALDDCGVIRGRDFAVASEAAEIVDAFEDDQPADTCWSKHVTIKAG